MTDLIVIPVYNEAPSIEKVFAQTLAAAPDVDVLAIDDGSTDGSPALLKRVTQNHPRVRVVHHETNKGYGVALMAGFEYARDNGYERVLTMDCDEQHDPLLIPRFLALAAKWDVVSGSRYMTEAPPRLGEVPRDRRQINRRITARVNELTGYELTDAFCGFKAYRIAALAPLQLSEPGYAFPLQFWLQAARAGLTVIEKPVPLIYVPSFERRFGGGLDDSDKRLAYYNEVIEKEVAKCLTC